MNKLLTMIMLLGLVACQGKDGTNGIDGKDGLPCKVVETEAGFKMECEEGTAEVEDGIDTSRESFYYDGNEIAKVVTVPWAGGLIEVTLKTDKDYLLALQYNNSLDTWSPIGISYNSSGPAYASSVYEWYTSNNCSGTPILIQRSYSKYQPQIVDGFLSDLNKHTLMVDKENLFTDIDKSLINSIGRATVNSSTNAVSATCWTGTQVTNDVDYANESNTVIMIENDALVSGFDHTVVLEDELVEIR